MHNVGLKALADVLEVSEMGHFLHLNAMLHAFHELVDVLRHHLVGLRIDMQDLHA